MPALVSASLNLPMASNIFSSSAEWEKPFSLSLVALTITITRIVCLLVEPAPSAWHRYDERRGPGPTFGLANFLDEGGTESIDGCPGGPNSIFAWPSPRAGIELASFPGARAPRK